MFPSEHGVKRKDKEKKLSTKEYDEGFTQRYNC